MHQGGQVMTMHQGGQVMKGAVLHRGPVGASKRGRAGVGVGGQKKGRKQVAVQPQEQG